MMADYAATYGGFPAPESPWRLFIAAVGMSPRYESRRQLSLMDAVTSAIGAAMGGHGGAAVAQRERSRLMQRAYPLKHREPELLPNRLHPGYVEPADA